MRALLSPALLFVSFASAQPQRPSFCFVLAEDHSAVHPFQGAVSVTQHFSEALRYVGIDKTYAGPWEVIPLPSGPLFEDSNERWMVYAPLARMTKEAYILVVHMHDTMQLDLPADPVALSMPAWKRWHRDTPEVIRFRRGRYLLADLMADAWSAAAAQGLAERLIAEDREVYERVIRAQDGSYRTASAKAMVPERVPPPQATAEEIEHEIAQRPGLKRVELDRIHADTVWVELTGRVMLDGGCASLVPLFGIEMRTDSGWVERIPFDLVQMDCGMPWADWEDHEVQLPPLRWWVGAHQPEGRKELVPGTYRLFFVGADLVRMNGEEFAITDR